MGETYSDIARLGDLADLSKWRRDADNIPEGPDPSHNKENVASINEIEEARRQKIDELQNLLEYIDENNRRTQILRQKFGSLPEEASEIDSDIDKKVNGYEDEGREFEGTHTLRTEAVEEESDLQQKIEFVEDDLKELVDLKRDYADAVIENSLNYDDETERYKVFFDDYEPDISLEDAVEFIEELKQDLIPLREQLEENTGKVDAGLEEFEDAEDYEGFEELCREVREMFGVEVDEMPLDTSNHGMEHGHQYISPLLISENKPWPKALLSFLHETGHGIHQLGLPKDEDFRTPEAEAGSYTVRESQARYIENHVGRSQEFWNELKERTGQNFDPETVYESVAGLDPENSIRVNSEELSYHLHIAARFEIERDLINGDLEVSELEQEWNQKMEEYLGLETELVEESDSYLQDVHWFKGKFGYFPTYTLGTAMAAQLHESDPELQHAVSDAEYEEVKNRLGELVYQHGYQKTSQELLEEQTGGELSSQEFSDYLYKKFTRMYELEE